MTEPSVGETATADGVPARGGGPAWFDASLWVLLSLVVAFVWTALPLLMVGMLRPVTFLVGYVPVSVLLLTLAFRHLPAAVVRDDRESLTWVAPASVVALVTVLSVFNAMNAAEHLRSNRDPGVYVVTAEGIADTGEVRFAAGEGAFAGAPDLRFAGPGFYEGPDPGEVTPQFLHLFPTALAVGRWVAGVDGLLRTNAVIGALGLLFFFGFSHRILHRPWLAAATTAALGLNTAQVHFTRDTYSEPLAQLLLWAGLWAAVAARERPSFGRWVLAGAALGATVATRVDAIVYLVPFVVVLAGWAFEARRRTAPTPAWWAAAVIGGAVSLALASVDALRYSRPYVRDLAPELAGVLALLVVTVAAAAVAATVGRTQVERVMRWSRSRAGALAAVLPIALLGAWLLRPWFGPARWGSAVPPGGGLVAGLQRLEGAEVDPFRSYAEAAMHRVQMTTGPVVLLLAAVGIWILARAVLQGRASWAWPFLGVVVAVTALYVVRPSIVGDLPWFWRRFLPVTIPGALVLAALGTEWLSRRTSVFLRPLVLGLCAVGLVARPVQSFADMEHVALYAPTATLVTNVCDSLGDDVAALVRPDPTLVAMPQTIQAFCDWPTAIAPAGLTVDRFLELAEAWEAQGRRLLYFTNRSDPFGEGTDDRVLTDVAVVASVPALERTLGRRPERVLQQPFRLYYTRVTPDPTEVEGP